MRWTVVIPAKALREAKSRLLPATSDLAAHHRLVRAIRADTEAAVAGATDVARIVRITDRPGPDHALVQREPGLNAALREAAEHSRTNWPDDGIVVLLPDLPALRAPELNAVLELAARYRRSFVADAAGTGTTLLAVQPGVPLEPRFGTDSAIRHGEYAVALPAAECVRRDVDTVADLRAAAELGVGPATAAALRDHGDEPRRRSTTVSGG